MIDYLSKTVAEASCSIGAFEIILFSFFILVNVELRLLQQWWMNLF